MTRRLTTLSVTQKINTFDNFSTEISVHMVSKCLNKDIYKFASVKFGLLKR